jgi:hypothetical protein
MNLQALRLNARYVPWPQQKIQVMSADDEFLGGGERRRTRRSAGSYQCGALRNASRMREDGRVEPAEGDSAVKVVLQVRNDALT